MRKIFSAVTLLLIASPAGVFACDGSVRCALRNAPRQMLELLPGFFSTHAGLFVGMIVSAGLIGVFLRREAARVRKD